MERRRYQIASTGLLVTIVSAGIFGSSCQAIDRHPGQLAREFAASYLEGRRDSTIHRHAVGAAKRKLELDPGHMQSKNATAAFLMDSTSKENRWVFFFRMTEPGSAVFPGEPSTFEITIESGKVTDYRFR